MSAQIFYVVTCNNDAVVTSSWIVWFVYLGIVGYSIYVRNLALNATPQHLEEEFKKFGAIKCDGIQVRSNKVWL